MSDLKAAISALAKGASERQEIKVPGLDQSVYSTALTVSDLQKIQIQSNGPDQEVDQNIYMIINKVTEKDGTPLYTVADKKDLKDYPWRIITEIVSQINDIGDFADQAEAEKD